MLGGEAAKNKLSKLRECDNHGVEWSTLHRGTCPWKAVYCVLSSSFPVVKLQSGLAAGATFSNAGLARASALKIFPPMLERLRGSGVRVPKSSKVLYPRCIPSEGNVEIETRELERELERERERERGRKTRDNESEAGNHRRHRR